MDCVYHLCSSGIAESFLIQRTDLHFRCMALRNLNGSASMSKVRIAEASTLSICGAGAQWGLEFQKDVRERRKNTFLFYQRK